MSVDGVFVFVGTYPDAEGAESDYEVVKELHSTGVVGTYDAAVVDKDDEGKVHVHKHEKPTQHGAWSGLAVGALLGILFPPGIIAGGIVGAAAGGTIAHTAGDATAAGLLAATCIGSAVLSLRLTNGRVAPASVTVG